MITLTDEQFKEMIEAAHRAGQHNQGHCDPSAYEAMAYYECEVKKLIIPDASDSASERYRKALGYISEATFEISIGSVKGSEVLEKALRIASGYGVG